MRSIGQGWLPRSSCPWRHAYRTCLGRRSVPVTDNDRSAVANNTLPVTRVRLHGQEARPERPTSPSVTATGQLVRACRTTLFSGTRRRVKAAYKNTSASPYARLRVYTDSYRTHQTENPVELLARDPTPRRDAHPNDRRTVVFDRSSTRAQHAYARAQPPLFGIVILPHLNRPTRLSDDRVDVTRVPVHFRSVSHGVIRHVGLETASSSAIGQSAR